MRVRGRRSTAALTRSLARRPRRSTLPAVPDGLTARQTGRVREWTVAGGLIQDDGQLLLVQNRRRNGALDWSPPGGVIEIADGESLLDGLTREVEEETGLRVTEWIG